MFDAYPLNGTDNLGAINCILRVAMNSSTFKFMVSISGSSGRKFDGVHIARTSNQRVVSGRTMMLPVDIYTLNLSVQTSSGFRYSNFSKRVNITRSNYSAISKSTSKPSPTPTSPTRVTPGNAWIAIVVVSIVVIGIVVVALALVAVCLCCCCKSKHQAEILQTVVPEEHPSHTTSFVEIKKSYEAAAELSSVVSDTDDEESRTPPFTTAAVPSSPTKEAPLKTSPPITEDEQLPSSPSTVEYRPLQTSPSTVEDRLLQTSSSAVEDRPPQTSPSTVGDRPSQTSPSTITVHVDDGSPPPAVEDRPPQTSPSTVEDRPSQTSPSTVTVHVDNGSPPSAVEDKSPQTSPSTVHVDDGSPPPAVEDRSPQTSPSAVAVVQEQTSISIANVMGLMENRPLFITSTQDLPEGIVVTRMDSHTGMSPDPTSTTADSEKALLPATSTPPPLKHVKHTYRKPAQEVTYPVQETTTTTADSEKALLPSPSPPPPVKRAQRARHKPAPHRPAKELTYLVQEATATADSEKALLPSTLPPVYTHPEPVVSHPVQETTTTTADSEKALLFSSSSPTPFVFKKQLSEGHPVQETVTTTTEELTMPSSLFVPTQPKPEARSPIQQTTKRSRTLSLPIQHTHSRPVVLSCPVGQQPKSHDEEVDSSQEEKLQNIQANNL